VTQILRLPIELVRGRFIKSFLYPVIIVIHWKCWAKYLCSTECS